MVIPILILIGVVFWIADWFMSDHPHRRSSGRRDTDGVFDEHIEEATFFRGGGDDF